jgi:hypothetical protein
MTKTAVAAPAPRPSDEEMLDFIASMTLLEFLRLKLRLTVLLIGRIAREGNL